MSNPEDNSKKTNGLSSDPMQRLASLKPPRDLTLGGNKANKKVFTPNLNVARNKNKGPTLPSGRDQKKDEKGRKDRRNDRNKNNRNGPSVIKSGGVFSEGLGSSEKHYGSRMSYGRDTESTPLQKPTIRVKDVIKIDKELEEQKVKSVLGGTSEYDENATEDFRRITEKDAPIKLPMDDGWSQIQKPAVKVKEEVAIKTEPGDDVDCAIISEDQKPLVDIKQEVFEDTDVANILRSDKPTLMFLELPDSLPGRGGRVEDEAPRRKPDLPSASADAGDDEKPADPRCRLADLEEGRVGTLQVHRSGRVTLKLGDTVFEVCSGTKAAFYQEAVSVATDESSRSANLIALGAIQHKLNVVPHWESMFPDLHV